MTLDRFGWRTQLVLVWVLRRSGQDLADGAKTLLGPIREEFDRRVQRTQATRSFEGVLEDACRRLAEWLFGDKRMQRGDTEIGLASLGDKPKDLWQPVVVYPDASAPEVLLLRYEAMGRGRQEIVKRSSSGEEFQFILCGHWDENAGQSGKVRKQLLQTWLRAAILDNDSSELPVDESRVQLDFFRNLHWMTQMTVIWILRSNGLSFCHDWEWLLKTLLELWETERKKDPGRDDFPDAVYCLETAARRLATNLFEERVVRASDTRNLALADLDETSVDRQFGICYQDGLELHGVLVGHAAVEQPQQVTAAWGGGNTITVTVYPHYRLDQRSESLRKKVVTVMKESPRLANEEPLPEHEPAASADSPFDRLEFNLDWAPRLRELGRCWPKLLFGCLVGRSNYKQKEPHSSGMDIEAAEDLLLEIDLIPETVLKPIVEEWKSIKDHDIRYRRKIGLLAVPRVLGRSDKTIRICDPRNLQIIPRIFWPE